MRKSHVCLGCSFDMRDVSAPLDPHYHLPIAQCPVCRAAAVRRRPRAPWKRTVRSIWWMALQLLVASLVLLTMWSVVVNLDLRQARFDLRYDPLITISLVATAIAMVITGAWLGAALRHIPLVKLLPGWAGLILIVVVLGSIQQPWHRWPRLAWREVIQNAKVAVLFFMITSAVASLVRSGAHGINAKSIARRVRKRRKRIERMMGE